MRTVVFLFVLQFFFQPAQAHPTAFQDSVGIMGYHSPMVSHNQLNYSFRYWFAAGVHHIKGLMAGKNRHGTFLSTNFLLKRWNGEALQANLYAVVGAGHSEISGEPKGAGLGVIQFDIEDRQYYFLAKHMEIANEEHNEMRQSTVRFGIAPYIDKFEGIHSWLILEYQHTGFNEKEKLDDLTPYLRVFYRNLLFEIGQSFNGFTRFNYIAHF